MQLAEHSLHCSSEVWQFRFGDSQNPGDINPEVVVDEDVAKGRRAETSKGPRLSEDEFTQWWIDGLFNCYVNGAPQQILQIDLQAGREPRAGLLVAVDQKIDVTIGGVFTAHGRTENTDMRGAVLGGDPKDLFSHRGDSFCGAPHPASLQPHSSNQFQAVDLSANPLPVMLLSRGR